MLEYVRRGFFVVASARRKEALEQVRAKASSPENVMVLPLDLSETSSLHEAVQKAIAFKGQVDEVLHCGGISQRSLVRSTSEEVDRKLMEVNFFGTVALTKAILPHMLERGSGHFGVVTSLTGKFGFKMRSAYAASKHALHGFFESLRLEEQDNGISVTMIIPGLIRTNISINALDADGAQQGSMDRYQQEGMDPADCAKDIYKAMQRRKLEALIGGKETRGVTVKRLFPRLFHKMISKRDAQ